MKNKKILIVGSGIAGPALAIQLIKMGFEVDVIESREEKDMEEGLFLGLSPNGINILKGLIEEEKLYQEFAPGAIEFLNAKGKKIAALDTDDQSKKFGTQSIQVKRSLISHLLRKELAKHGVSIRYGCKLKGFEKDGELIFAKTGGRTLGPFHCVVGADGVHSKTRKLIFPNGPDPIFTNHYSTGAAEKIQVVNSMPKKVQMTFGNRAFFGLMQSNQGEVWWFNNFYHKETPVGGEKINLGQDDLKARLIALHRDDHPIIVETISKSKNLFAYPIYEIPPLPCWFREQVVLIGDAAHAVTPHTGQGASLALEDSVVLSRCLSTYDSLETAFTRFQAVR